MALPAGQAGAAGPGNTRVDLVHPSMRTGRKQKGASPRICSARESGVVERWFFVQDRTTSAHSLIVQLGFVMAPLEAGIKATGAAC
jgi:hypothetical protein